MGIHYTDENNPGLFWQKKTCGICCCVSLASICQKTCSRMKCDWRNFHSEAENFQICYQMQTGENPVNKDHCVTKQILSEHQWGEMWSRKWEIEEFGLCGQRNIWIAASKFDKFCKRKFNKCRILFWAVFVNFISIHFSAELALEIRITLHCCETKNYKFTTMFHLWLSTLCTSCHSYFLILFSAHVESNL